MTASDPGLLWGQRATTRVTVYLNGTATDITGFVLQPPRGGAITSNGGRQTELSQMDASRLTFTLDNADGRFTPNNTSSPYHPYWRMGARVTWTETLGHETYTHFDGYLELPQLRIGFDTGVVNDSTVAVSAVDTLTQLGRSAPFLSNLAAYIESSASAGSLVGYWPMTELAAPFVSRRSGGALWPVVQTVTGVTAIEATVFPADQDGPGGEDVSFLRLSPLFTGVGVVAYPDIRATLPVTLDSEETLAISCWTRPDLTGNALEPLAILINLHLDDTSVLPAQFFRITNYTVGPYAQAVAHYDVPTGSNATAQSTSAVGPDVWTLVTGRVALPSGDVELWVGREAVATATMSGTPPTQMDFDTITVADQLVGAVGHVQVYVGEDVFPFEEHLAQWEHGLTGLERQRTGERISTILGYAGVDHDQLDRVDEGTSVMRRVSLAGKTVLEAVQEAADTERGRLFTAGTGEITHHDRRRVYDV